MRYISFRQRTLIKRTKDSDGKREEKAEECQAHSCTSSRESRENPRLIPVRNRRDRSPVTITLLLSRKRVKPSTNSPQQTLSPPTRSSGGIRADIDLFFFFLPLSSLLSFLFLLFLAVALLVLFDHTDGREEKTSFTYTSSSVRMS